MSIESPEGIDLSGLLEEIKKLTDGTTEIDNEVEVIRAAYIAQVDALKARKLALKAALREKSDELKELERKKASEDAQKERAREIAMLNERITTLSDELDTLTSSAKWREFAYDHQIYAGKRIAFTHGFILADNMGLGKTLSSILSLDMIAAKTKEASPENPIESGFPGSGLPLVTKQCGKKVLYLCPKSLLTNVKKEFSEWAPDRHVFAMVDSLAAKAGRDMLLQEILPKSSEFTLIINHEAWRRDKKLLTNLINLEFDTIVVDEAHRLKSVDSDAYATVIKLINSSAIPFRLMMTGTPILNRPDDIFTALHIIAPRHFPSRSNFLYAYCDQKYVASGSGFRLVWTFRPGGEKRLLNMIESMILKRSLSDVGITLPPVTTVIHELEVDSINYPEQYRAYAEMKKYGAALAADGTQAVQASVIIAMLTRLRQLLHWPAGIKLVDPNTLKPIMEFDIRESQKLDYVLKPMELDDSRIQAEGLIPDVCRHEYNPEGARVVMFSQFTSVLNQMKERLTAVGYKVAMITGETPNIQRTKVQLDFDRRELTRQGIAGNYDIVLVNYGAGGVGLNLTDATVLIALDAAWGPKQRDQAYARLHRIGQESPVTIHEISVTGTVDSWMLGIMSAKAEMLDGFETELDVRSAFREAIENGLI